MATTTSSKEISAGFRARETPPRAPREVLISPAIESCETIFARKDGGIF